MLSEPIPKTFPLDGENLMLIIAFLDYSGDKFILEGINIVFSFFIFLISIKAAVPSLEPVAT